MKVLTAFLVVVTFATTACAQTPKYDGHPETVVLIHGYGRSDTAMWRLAQKIESVGYHVQRVDYSSLTQDIDGIKAEVFGQIDECCADRSQKVHFVGHSMGGLLVRSYLGERTVENLGNVVIMGSPNKGTPVVDRYESSWWFAFGGPAVKSLSANGSAFLDSLQPPYYNLGVIAGDKENASHEHILEGKDDGLVPLESTKVTGMKDFIVLNTSHSMMRYDDEVAAQTINFLKHASFAK